jgi:hypothetical protein
MSTLVACNHGLNFVETKSTPSNHTSSIGNDKPFIKSDPHTWSILAIFMRKNITWYDTENVLMPESEVGVAEP